MAAGNLVWNVVIDHLAHRGSAKAPSRVNWNWSHWSELFQFVSCRFSEMFMIPPKQLVSLNALNVEIGFIRSDVRLFASLCGSRLQDHTE